ncbi:MAG: ribonuclease D [Alphaproteobacteria bacterium]|nr:ribonuclease D [Alphaproteobacteria bacterium]MBN2780024.1 ribonuclease D [Alphaproteobacteria bacterium]
MIQTPAICYVQHDLPKDFKLQSNIVAIDCEMTGLSLTEDKLCLLQIWDGVGPVYLVQFSDGYDAPRLKSVLSDESIQKIFHYGRKDLSFIATFLSPVKGPLFDTKIAYRVLKPTDPIKASLKELAKLYANIDLDKGFAVSDWFANPLSKEQIKYAAEDVLYLHEMAKNMTDALKQAGKWSLAQASFAFIPLLTQLDREVGDEFYRLFKYN